MDDYTWDPSWDQYFTDMFPDQSYGDFFGDQTTYWDPSWDQYFQDVNFNDPNAPSMGDFFGDQTSWLDRLNIPGLGSLGGLLQSPLTGALLGAGLGSLNGAQQAGVTTTTAAPWGPQQPYLQDLFSRAQAASQASAFPSADELFAYNQGLGLSSLGSQQIADTFSGAYMNPNNPLYKSILDDATQQVTSRFYNQDQTGPLGSRSGFGDTFGKTLANQLSSNLFNPERQRQVAYASMYSPSAGYGMAQGMRMDPFKALQNYGSLIGGQFGSVRTEPYYTNPIAGGIGGALAGTQLWGNLFPK